MSEISYKNTDFILKTKCDKALIARVEKYEAFLSVLCKEEYYFQKDAIYNVLKYFFSDKYKNLWDLAKENYAVNEKLRQRFDTEKKYKEHLQLPEQKSCSIDLATGTGKSFVIYGLAQIMLAEGLVDQVLVLCPSRTIEDGLTEKFVALAGNKILKESLAKTISLTQTASLTNPRIVNATRTIKKGDICIENIHAVYKNTGSSIDDSLRDNGSRTLVLNDEAHHIFNKVTGTSNESVFKEWKKFLLKPEYRFYFVVNFSGTPYIRQEYFTDIVYRYGLKDGIEEKVIKSVEYKIEVGDEKKMKGFQEIWDNHRENKKNYIKPISIVITADIPKCVEVYDELVKFIAQKEKITPEIAKKKAIWIVSGIPAKSSTSGKKIFKLVEKPEKERQKNLQLLKEVDNPKNPVEWIVSVAMLTEGWDVKNVFQIVPHESKAFNSKLLIAQVLGRGLRIPEIYKGKEGIKVRVYNHTKFSAHIKNLVDEVLEIEDRFSWFPVKRQAEFNFDLHNLSYKKDLKCKHKKRKLVKFSEKINLGPQSKEVINRNTYQEVFTDKKVISEHNNATISFNLEDAAKEIRTMLVCYEPNKDTEFRSKYTKAKIKEILKSNLPSDSRDFISYENFNKAKNHFGKLLDIGGDSSYFKDSADQLQTINTSEIIRQSVSATSLKRESMCCYTEDTMNSLSGDERTTFQKMLDNEEDYKVKKINRAEMKSPLNCILVSHKPEREFIKRLFQDVELFDSFIKNPDKSFYNIPYSFKKGTHMKHPDFYPDFFFKKGKDILIVEIKQDEDDSDENKAKDRDARKHFEMVNEKQKNQKYYSYFLSREDYGEFFQAVRENRYKKWQSSLMMLLRAKS